MKITDKITEHIKKSLQYTYRDLPPELQETMLRYVLVVTVNIIIVIASIPAFLSVRITLVFAVILLIFLASYILRFFQICRGEYVYLIASISNKEKTGNRYMISFSYEDKDYAALISNRAFQKLQTGDIIKMYVKSNDITADNESSYILKYPSYIYMLKNEKTVPVNYL